MTSGIYLWTVDRSSEDKIPLVYVGQAKNLNKRKKEHLDTFKTRSHNKSNKRLINAVAHYGINKLNYDVLEYCDSSSLTSRESYWYNYYRDMESLFELANFTDPQENPMDNPESRAKAAASARRNGVWGSLSGGWCEGSSPAKKCILEREGIYYQYTGAKSFLKYMGLYTKTRERAFQALISGRYRSYLGFKVASE